MKYVITMINSIRLNFLELFFSCSNKKALSTAVSSKSSNVQKISNHISRDVDGTRRRFFRHAKISPKLNQIQKKKK